MKNSFRYKSYFRDNTILTCEPFLCEDEKYRIIYKITFLDGKYYIGKHASKNYNDGYCGSGTLLPKEYKRHNLNECTKEILSFYKNDSELNKAEKEIIGDLYFTDKKCLNLTYGGDGGFTKDMVMKSAHKRIGKKRSQESIEKQRKACFGKKQSDETKKKISEWHKNFFLTSKGEEKKKKLSDIHKGKHLPQKVREKMGKTIKEKHKQLFLENIHNKNFKEALTYALNHRKEDVVMKVLEDDYFYNLFFKATHKENPIVSGWHITFTEEHKKHISESKKGIKLSEETKVKMSEHQKGRKNSNYNPTQVLMLSTSDEVLRVFKDGIEAKEYIIKTKNPKASTNEIFVACRKNKIRYGYKWKFKE